MIDIEEIKRTRMYDGEKVFWTDLHTCGLFVFITKKFGCVFIDKDGVNLTKLHAKGRKVFWYCLSPCGRLEFITEELGHVEVNNKTEDIN